MDVGARIRYFREKKQISVNKLANLSGVSQSYVREVELGNKQPTVQYLEYLCYGLGITLQDFFSENELRCERCPIEKLTSKQKDSLIQFLNNMIDDASTVKD